MIIEFKHLHHVEESGGHLPEGIVFFLDGDFHRAGYGDGAVFREEQM